MQKEKLLGDYSKLISDTTLLTVLTQIQKEYATKPILPNKEDVFKAFKSCPYNNLKVVILGQDPYPQRGYATGLAFANPSGTKDVSPSLDKIIGLIMKDFPDYESFCDLPFGDPYEEVFDITLNKWAEQGVLLLNSSLTVEESRVGSHSNIWYSFMKELLGNLSEINSGIIYLLFGSDAKVLGTFINKHSNYVFGYDHPAYYARVNKGFECDGFIKANQILKQNNNLKINWNGENV